MALRLAEIARVAHELNRAYCQAIGDNSQVAWEDAPQWQRESAIAGIRLLAQSPRTPEEMHAEWMAHKTQDGWKYGPVKDPEKKEHPCMVPYDQLPKEQRVKDFLFVAVVSELLKI